jgi:hypothetical protein
MMTGHEASTTTVEEGESKTQTPEELFYELLAQMPENMRLYQQLRQKERSFYDKHQAHSSRLADIDIDLPAHLHPQEITTGAMALYLADRNLQSVRKQMREMDVAGDWAKFMALRGRDILVTPIEDSRIHKSIDGSFMGSIRDTKEGRVRKISLTPSDGGWIEFNGKIFKGTDLSADPLFDPYTFEPHYEIELL